ncbi:MAG: Flp pilus assembly complex ATPase component TadA [Candidatus Omnitrophica bacterium]|nr:Flp pilus assembly complex ATPase component TadA [Candidatus Omnitrophota bacterium]
MPKKIDILLSDALIEKNLLTLKDSDALLKEADSLGVSLQQLLLSRHFLPENDILKVLAEKLHLSCVDLKNTVSEKPALDKVPVKIASYYKFLPLRLKDRVLSIVVAAPLDIKTQDEIRTQLGLDIEMLLACSNDVHEALKKHYGLAADTLDQINAQSQGSGANVETVSYEKVEDIEKLAEDASVIKLVNQIILEAYRKRATDIHLEPYRGGVALRYRVDGVLYDANVALEIKNFLNAIISRIKIMSNLNIVERRLPQDGRAIVRVQDQVLDLRISTIPTPFGESVVVRILPTQMLFSLEKLGLAKKDLQIFEKLVLEPHGIIFVTGPTGSGKTTTLYACLNRINTKDRKIITIEDPIEYEMAGITQIQVQPEIGLDFARGLRSILRHDPDVIMVGEVRDLETAEIAIRVALTGHLVFSTLHTNDAPSGITRLLDIGVEPYLMASSVEAFIAQRLIRVLCPDCKQEDSDAPDELKQLIAIDLGVEKKDVKIMRGKGCNNCNFTGFFGRTAIYEMLLIDDAIRDLILKKASSEQIKKLAVSKGMRTLRQDGWNKVLNGVTTPEEVMKVTSAEEIVGDAGVSASSSVMPSPNNTPNPLQEAERRAFMRVSCVANLRYKIFNAQDNDARHKRAVEQFSVTKDISAGGIMFVASEPVAVGSIIELTIEVPDGGKPIETLAKVVRVDATAQTAVYNVAVCFLVLASV